MNKILLLIVLVAILPSVIAQSNHQIDTCPSSMGDSTGNIAGVRLRVNETILLTNITAVSTSGSTTPGWVTILNASAGTIIFNRTYTVGEYRADISNATNSFYLYANVEYDIVNIGSYATCYHNGVINYNTTIDEGGISVNYNWRTNGLPVSSLGSNGAFMGFNGLVFESCVSNPGACGGGGGGSPSANFSIVAVNGLGANISGFSVLINGTIRYNDSSGTINFPFNTSNWFIFNITAYAPYGYVDSYYRNYNTSASLSIVYRSRFPLNGSYPYTIGQSNLQHFWDMNATLGNLLLDKGRRPINLTYSNTDLNNTFSEQFIHLTGNLSYVRNKTNTYNQDGFNGSINWSAMIRLRQHSYKTIKNQEQTISIASAAGGIYLAWMQGVAEISDDATYGFNGSWVGWAVQTNSTSAIIRSDYMIYSGTPPALNTWNSYLITHDDKGVIKTYVNGVLNNVSQHAAFAWLKPQPAATAPFGVELSGQDFQDLWTYDGDMQYVAFWNKTLNTSEIALLSGNFVAVNKSYSFDVVVDNPDSFVNATTYINVYVYNITNVTDMNGSLLLGGVLQNTTKFFNGSYASFLSNFSAPSGNTAFVFNLTYAPSNDPFNWSNYSSSKVVSSWGMVSCDSGSKSFKVSTFKESVPSESFNVSVEYIIEYGIVSSIERFNYSGNFSSNNTFTWCINSSTGNLSVDFYMIYGGIPERYYSFNDVFRAGVQKNVSVYGINDTAGLCTLTINENSVIGYTPFSNVWTRLQRRYVGEGVWRNVQDSLTGDFGTALFYVRPIDTDYRLLYYKTNGDLLKQTSALQFNCPSGVVTINQLLNPDADSVVSGVSASTSFNNNTDVVSMIWSNTGSTSPIVEFVVTKKNVVSDFNICEVTQSGAAGSTACNVSGYSGVIFSKTYVNGVLYSGTSVDLGSGGVGSVMVKSDGAFLSLLIMVTIIMIGLWSPYGVILMGGLSLIVIYSFGLISGLLLSGVIGAIVVGLVLSLSMKRGV
jgi:hypothetical protein